MSKSPVRNKFYAHGKGFTSWEEFIQFCREWPEMPCDLYEFKKQMDIFTNSVEMNIEMSSGLMTNRQAYLTLRLSTDWATKRNDMDTPDGKGES